MKSENSVCTVFRADDFRDADGDHRIVAEYAAKRANRLLSERGTRVYGRSWDEARNESEATMGWGANKNSTDTHTALLVAVEPLRKESAESLLAEFVEIMREHRGDSIERLADLSKRTARMLEGG